MFETSRLALPMLAAAQAQKHVTVNEALARLDALTAPTALSADVAGPPPEAGEGDAYIVGAPAVDEWRDRENQLAFFVNGGWEFAPPQPGWRVWVSDRMGALTWTGTNWAEDLVGPVAFGAFTRSVLVAGEEVVPAGSAFATSLTIPDRAMVLGVTARVVSAISGPALTGWRIGVAGSDNRYGNAIGLAAGSVANGVTSAPVGYFADTPLLISPEGGDFSGGAIRLAIHALALTPPSV